MSCPGTICLDQQDKIITEMTEKIRKIMNEWCSGSFNASEIRCHAFTKNKQLVSSSDKFGAKKCNVCFFNVTKIDRKQYSVCKKKQ